MINRRHLLRAAAAGGLLGQAAVLAATRPSRGRLDLQTRTPHDDLMIWGKLKADLSGRTLYSITTGTVWGFKPQADETTLDEFAKRLYGYATCSVRRGAVTADGLLRIRSRSWNFYLHPQTREFTRELLNPYTGKMVNAAPSIGVTREQTYSVAGPVGEAPAIPLETRQPPRPFDLQVRSIGDTAFVDESSFIRFKSKDISWYKLEGNLWSHACRLRDLTDPSLTHIPSTWTQNLIAEWQTWMNMHGEPGHILFKGDGCNVERVEHIPEDLRRYIETVSPGGLRESLGGG